MRFIKTLKGMKRSSFLSFRRVKMPEMTDAFPAGTVARVSGWGEKGDGLGSDVLMAADLKIDPDQSWKISYKNNLELLMKKTSVIFSLQRCLWLFLLS